MMDAMSKLNLFKRIFLWIALISFLFVSLDAFFIYEQLSPNWNETTRMSILNSWHDRVTIGLSIGLLFFGLYILLWMIAPIIRKEEKGDRQ